MGDSSHEASTFWTQADALLRKNLTYQKRNVNANLRLILFPLVLCLLLVLLQSVLDSQLNKSDKKCGCQCIDTNGDGSCEKVCGLEFSDAKQARTCLLPSPAAWPPLLQVPAPEYRAVKSSSDPSADLPDESCRRTGSCPVTVFISGSNQTLGEILAGNMFTSSGVPNPSNLTDIITNIALGSSKDPQEDTFLDPAFDEDDPLYYLQRQCLSNSAFNVSVPDPDSKTQPRHLFQKGTKLSP